MRNNLSDIERRISRLERQSSNSAAVARIQREMDRKGCSAAAQTGRETQNESLLSRVFSGTRDGPADTLAGTPTYRTLPNGLVVPLPSARLQEVRATPADEAALPRRSSEGRSAARRSLPAGGTFRTLCVRTCDGFYFPVSFSTGLEQFANDAARCTEICPAAPTALFVHRNPGEMTEDMISLAGVPYAETENAYRFRSELVPQCSCRNTTTQAQRISGRLIPLAGANQATGTQWTLSLRTGGGLDSPAGLDEADTLGGSARYARTPMRPDHIPFTADPDTRSNLEGGFDATVAISTSDGRAPMAAPDAPRMGGLPILGPAPGSAPDRTKDTAASPEKDNPVFTNVQTGQPLVQTETERASIRVVGPEYFVAQ
ncbi:hypothetical protein GCM10011316_13130 [Roseibium aquae]|uniref:DUF2865 domain-containing protein n=2 Tax=Roseibium aquae TaxID=1323746 RepID=A0A916WZS9_9HYPH|nr:hypothetical protein GCM10011316_13130 [Roseibium aquae]